MIIGSPIVTSQQMRQIEEKAFAEGASAESFMEAVASNLLELIQDELPHHIGIIVGKGNNGGDGACLAGLLLDRGFEVDLITLFEPSDCSELLQKHLDSFKKRKKHLLFEEIENSSPNYDLIIDALLGTGCVGSPEGKLRRAIDYVNRLGVAVWSIDIPSGLVAKKVEDALLNDAGSVIAERTYFLGAAKREFFEEDNFKAVGRLMRVDFGLSIKEPSQFHLVEPKDIQKLLLPISRLRHKYDAGAVLGIVDNPEMSGAMALCSFAAFRSGAGYVKLAIRRPAYPEEYMLAATLPREVVRCFYNPKPSLAIKELLSELSHIKACVVGPGFSLSKESGRFLKLFLKEVKLPMVIDGGAIRHIANKKATIPAGSILTPHLGELKSLLGIEQFPTEEAIRACQQYVEDREVTLVVKGAPTYIFHPEKPILISPFGSPGMATAGAGDVLAGAIAAQLGMGLNPREAAALGVALHGLAGEFATDHLGVYSLVAGDIIDQIPNVLRHFFHKHS